MSITVYTRTTCAPCKTVKHFLKSKGYAFEEKNVDDNPELMAEVLRISGYQAVPLTMVNNAPIMGMNLSALASLLRAGETVISEAS